MNDSNPFLEPVPEGLGRPEGRESDPARVWISSVLRFGSYGSTALILAGIVGGLLHPAPLVPCALRDLPGRVLEWDAGAIMQAGIVLLLMTPVIRIVVAMASFARERDYRYTWVSIGVLLVVLSSILLRVVQ